MSIVRVVLLLCTCDREGVVGSVDFVSLLGTSFFSITVKRIATLSSSGDSRFGRTTEMWTLKVFLSRPKMADVRATILCFLVVF